MIQRRQQWWWMALLFTCLSGCGVQQFSPTSRELMRPLYTAVSSKQMKWIDATEEKIKTQWEEGEITELEFNFFEQVIQQSRSGNWKEAQHTLHQQMSGQRATADDLARLAKS